MLINGKREEYKVIATQWGWSYAIPIIYGRRKFFGFLERWKKLRNDENNYKLVLDLQNMKPQEMEYWFTKSVEDYEEYLDAWGK